MEAAKQTFYIVIDAGHADVLHPKTDVNAGEIISGRDLVINTRPYLEYPLSKVVLTISQCVDALSLLEQCGWKLGNYEEMWAFVFVGNVQIGYIWLRQRKVEPWALGSGNETAAVAGS